MILTPVHSLLEIPTFLVAGNETTSVATAWCLYALSHDFTVQNKLRDELLSLGSDVPTMEELNNLPYLDGVVRETLRLYSPVHATVRIATKDDVVPLGTPFMDRKGRLQHTIRSASILYFGVIAPVLIMFLNFRIRKGGRAITSRHS